MRISLIITVFYRVFIIYDLIIFDDFRFYTIEDVAKLLAHWGFNIIGSGASKICLQRMN